MVTISSFTVAAPLQAMDNPGKGVKKYFQDDTRLIRSNIGTTEKTTQHPSFFVQLPPIQSLVTLELSMLLEDTLLSLVPTMSSLKTSTFAPAPLIPILPEIPTLGVSLGPKTLSLETLSSSWAMTVQQSTLVSQT